MKEDAGHVKIMYIQQVHFLIRSVLLMAPRVEQYRAQATALGDAICVSRKCLSRGLIDFIPYLYINFDLPTYELGWRGIHVYVMLPSRSDKHAPHSRRKDFS